MDKLPHEDLPISLQRKIDCEVYDDVLLEWAGKMKDTFKGKEGERDG